MIEVIGREGISAKIVAHSVSSNGLELLTYELEYPRFILSELNTHRVLSKNSSSSRAIPVKKVLELIDGNPAMPVHWGKNQPGMSAKEELVAHALTGAKALWVAASKSAMSQVQVLDDIGLHKQISNRILEPWARMKTICTGTEWMNFFYLRNHPDAQPEIAELASVMIEALSLSTPFFIKSCEWHLPYLDRVRNSETGELNYVSKLGDDDHCMLYTLEEAQMISVSCCAQVSYRKQDDSIEKAKKVYAMLNIGSTTKPNHSSPLEHLATPMDDISLWHREDRLAWKNGITHITRDGALWSGNFKGWIQYRKLMESS